MPKRIEKTANADMGSQELTEEIIRLRAYELFEQRGGRHGYDMDDWLQAEAEVMGKKRVPSAERTERARDAAAA